MSPPPWLRKEEKEIYGDLGPKPSIPASSLSKTLPAGAGAGLRGQRTHVTAYSDGDYREALTAGGGAHANPYNNTGLEPGSAQGGKTALMHARSTWGIGGERDVGQEGGGQAHRRREENRGKGEQKVGPVTETPPQAAVMMEKPQILGPEHNTFVGRNITDGLSRET